ncbi:MAG: hypothetical protein P9X24_02530 [Candidatus Hatepunaea meridiana]|nr:hypothetical protein [Candidatus Hatepunaea meridiana]
MRPFFLLIVLLLSGCDNNGDDTPTDPGESTLSACDLFPLTVGNRWTYIGMKNGEMEAEEIREIVCDTTLLNRKCYRMEYDFHLASGLVELTKYYSYQSDTIFWNHGHENSWFKMNEFLGFPEANEGDTIHQSEYRDHDYFENSVYIVHQKYASINLEAGVFDSCYVVKIERIKGANSNIENRDVFYDYYAIGIGFIYEEWTRTSGDVQDVEEWELQTYDIR